jgi:hypothetical protein
VITFVEEARRLTLEPNGWHSNHGPFMLDRDNPPLRRTLVRQGSFEIDRVTQRVQHRQGMMEPC